MFLYHPYLSHLYKSFEELLIAQEDTFPDPAR